MKKWLVLFICFFLVACANNETTAPDLESVDPQQLKEELLELTEMFGDEEVDHAHIDRAVLEAESLGLKGKERDFFVRSYLIYVTTGKELNIDDIKEDSQLRMLYEEAWQELANEKYEVTVEQQQLEELIDTYLEHVNMALDAEEEVQGIDIFYLAEALDYSLEQFFYNFDKHHFEKWLIGQQLFPILQEEYGMIENHEISNQYRLEVINYIVDSES